MASAGEILRDARSRMHLSQVELARRAGVTQSVVSAYESGARQPSLPTLQRLVSATGNELEIVVRDASTPRTDLGERLHRQRRRVREVAAAHGISNVRVFGSVARGEEHPESDIDLLVDLAPQVGLIGLAHCETELEELLGARVDLVPAGDLKESVAAHVLLDARPL